jgi:group I intron endonuclease
MVHSIYKFVNKINGKVYIGYTNNVNGRIRSHRFSSKKVHTAFYAAIKKYGWNNFSFELIYQSLDEEHCHGTMEEYFIREYKSHVDDGFGYNMTYGGDGQKNPSKEIRWKIGTANRGKIRGPCKEETKRKIGLANSKKKRTPEEKEHLRQINLGRKQSVETVLKRSKSYIVTDPFGQKQNVINLTKFCKENNLNQGAMAAIARGKAKQHKGWSCLFS